MMISQAGLDFVKRHERFIDHIYDDGFGTPTIGYGHKVQTGESFPATITMDQALSILAADTQTAQNAINNTVKVPLSQPQYDALVSLVFNWGSGNWGKSSHLKYLNAGDYERTAQRISQHPITSKGRIAPGLVTRRQEEAALFRSGMDQPSTPATFDAGDNDDPDVSDDAGDLSTYLLLGVGLFLGLLLVSKLR